MGTFVRFTSTAGFCPNRKASSRSTGPGGLAAAGSSHSKSEAASNLHLGGDYYWYFLNFCLDKPLMPHCVMRRPQAGAELGLEDPGELMPRSVEGNLRGG